MHWLDWMDKFPINSQEILFIAMIFSILMYILVSLITCRKPFNLDRMLHRGIYSTEGDKKVEKSKFSIRRVLVGIDENYTFGDKCIAWSAFLYGVGYLLVLKFLMVFIWNAFHRWPEKWWSIYMFATMICMAGLVAIITSIWFTIGSVRDLRQLFAELRNKKNNALDDGSVIGHVSADEAATIGKIEESNADKA